MRGAPAAGDAAAKSADQPGAAALGHALQGHPSPADGALRRQGLENANGSALESATEQREIQQPHARLLSADFGEGGLLVLIEPLDPMLERQSKMLAQALDVVDLEPVPLEIGRRQSDIVELPARKYELR